MHILAMQKALDRCTELNRMTVLGLIGLCVLEGELHQQHPLLSILHSLGVAGQLWHVQLGWRLFKG